MSTKQYEVTTVSGRTWSFYSIERAEMFASQNLGSIRSWK
jgi:hypothetical protein